MTNETVITVKNLVSVYYRNFMNKRNSCSMDVHDLFQHAYEFNLITKDELENVIKQINTHDEKI